MPLTLYFLALGVTLHGQLRIARLSLGWEIVKNVVLDHRDHRGQHRHAV
ncbi:MAG TPA: hypothetical protein VF458_00570 [Ktedonobacteraceae bacterium]